MPAALPTTPGASPSALSHHAGRARQVKRRAPRPPLRPAAAPLVTRRSIAAPPRDDRGGARRGAEHRDLVGCGRLRMLCMVQNAAHHAPTPNNATRARHKRWAHVSARHGGRAGSGVGVVL